MQDNHQTPSTIGDALNSEYRMFAHDKIITNFKDSFVSINPACVIQAVECMKKEICKTNDHTVPNYNDFNIYFTLGTRYCSDEFYIGVLSALLWLKTYFQHLYEMKTINFDELEVVKSVFAKGKIPDTEDIKPSYYYSSFLYSIGKWCNSMATVKNFNKDEENTNKESSVATYKNNYDLASYLMKCSVGGFPAVPYSAYYIGSINNIDPQQFLSQINNNISFERFFTKESIMVNNPKFEIMNAFSPITECAYSPFRELFVLQKEGAKSEWITIFRDSEEFEKLCVEKGLNVEDVKKYTIGMTLSKHKENLAKQNPIATFIDSSTGFRQLFETYAQEFENKKTGWMKKEGPDDPDGSKDPDDVSPR